MGCDIHMHFEIKLAGQWHHYSSPRFPRCYPVFACMAGVRAGKKYPGEPKRYAERGLPADISAVTAMASERMGDDGHSHSWLTMPEFKPIALWYEHNRREEDKGWFSLSHSVLGYLCGNDLYEWSGPYRDSENEENECGYDPRIEDVRVVFWFDN